MSIGVIYVVLIISVYISNTCGLHNVVRASQQTPESSRNEPSESSPIVSAVLLECPRELANSQQQKPHYPCEQQLMVNIRVNPSFHVEKCEKFLILDEVYDPRKRSKAKIMSPYLIEISRGEPVMMYPLEFTKTVRNNDLIPKSDRLNCQNYDGKSKLTNDFRTANTTTTLTTKAANRPSPESDPEQDSLNRVMDKITDAFAAVKQSDTINEEEEPFSCNDQLKRLPNSYKSFQNLNSAAQTLPASKIMYNEYGSVNDNDRKQFEPFHQTYDFRKRLAAINPLGKKNDENFKSPVIGYYAGDYRELHDNKNPSARESQTQSVANVGVPDKLFKKLEESGRHVAQLGSITYSENKQKPSIDAESNCKVNLKSRNTGNPDLNRKSSMLMVQRENGQNENLHITDYSLTPIHSADLNQQQAEIHAEMEDDSDEISPASYMERSLPKFRKFRGGRKRGRKKKKQKTRPRSSNLNQQMSQKHLEDDEVDYVEDANPPTGKEEEEQQNVPDRNQNNKDLEATQEQESHELLEKDEPTYVKPHVASDLFENFEKINVITSGNRKPSPEEDEETHYLEMEKKQHMPVAERIHFIPHDGDYRVEPIPLQEVDLCKRDNDEKNIFGRTTYDSDTKLSNSDSQVELERTQINIIDKANYKPLEMPQYDYDEDNKQIVFIHNSNKKFNSEKNMAYAPSKKVNYGPANEKSLRNKNVHNLLQKGGQKGEESQSNLKSSKKLLDGFEAVSSYPNNKNVLNSVNKDYQKTILSNKLISDSRKENLKNKYIENNLHFNPKDQSNSKLSFDLTHGLKNSFSQPLNKIEIPKISFDNRFEYKPYWKNNNNNNNDNNYNDKPILESTNTAVGFDVDEIIRHHTNNYKQNYKLPISLQSPANQAKLYLNNEPNWINTNMPPYSRIIDDPNLNINDKLAVLDIIDTKNENAESVQNEIYNDILKSYIILETPSPVPIEEVTINPKLINVRKSQDSSKKKRSFVFYDDLEMRDTLMDNDYNFDDTAQKRRDRERIQSVSRHVQEDVSPCATCGGKGKKPIQKNPAFNPHENACRCRNQRTTCNCPDSHKDVRSVSDAWYAVFNMSAPLPFLTTKLRIFRKRHNIWWKIVPSITLSSLSGIFANANLSILFSSHVDIFQLEKSLRLQNHQLLIPKDDRPVRQNVLENQEIHNETPNLNKLNINPSNILAVENPKFLNWNSMKIAAYSENEQEASALEAKNNYRLSRFADANKAVPFEKTAKSNGISGNDVFKSLNGNNLSSVRTIAELGYFPTTMNLLEYCPYDRNRLCLNMLEDRVPAYSIKVKLPFRENALIHRHIYKVSIARIVTDATTANVLQVSVDVINKGLFAHEFAICVCNCPMAKGGAKNRVKKLLLPHVGETVTFLLPLILDPSIKKHKKFNCDVTIREAGSLNKANKNKHKSTMNHQSSTQPSKQNGPCKQETDQIVSIRIMTVEPEFRCFCIWDCKCHCVPKLETYVDFHVCQKMSEKDITKAGLISCEEEDEICLKNLIDDVKDNTSGGRFYWFIHNALILLGIMLVLGVLKAVLGLASTKVDKWGYEYVQPTSIYEDATKSRRFFVNTFFFIVFPFLFWCKCFTPSEDDLLVASTEWQCSLIQDSRRSSEDDDYDNCGYKVGRFSDEEEDVMLSQHIDRKSSKSGCRSSGGADIINMDTRLNDWNLAFNEGVFDDDDDADEEANTKFVLQALVESRESLKKLLKNHGTRKLDVVSEEVEPRIKQAEDLVQNLKAARIVYRAFDRPVGNVRNIPFGIRYCVQGYFLPSLGSEYEFVNYNPMAQYRCISADGTSLEVLRPPIVLCPQEFSRVYADPLNVLEAGDLFITPPSMTPCINITTIAAVASSVAKLASDQSCNENSSSSSSVPRGSQQNQLNASFVRSQQPYRISTGEEDPSDLDLPSPSQVALNISNMNEEMMNESMQQPIEDESIDLVDDASIEFTPHHCDTIEE